MSDKPALNAFEMGRIITRLSGLQLLVFGAVHATYAGPFVQNYHLYAEASRVGLHFVLAVVLIGRTDAVNRSILGLRDNASYRGLAFYMVHLIGCWMFFNALLVLSTLGDLWHYSRVLHVDPAQRHAAVEVLRANVVRLGIYFFAGCALISGPSRLLVDLFSVAPRPRTPAGVRFGESER